MFLLKNRKLSVQLFLGLLLVLGAIPDGSEGLECFKCNQIKSNPAGCKSQTKVTCGPGENLCTIEALKTATRDTLSKGCSDSSYGKSCRDVNNGAGYNCFCEEDLCNDDKKKATDSINKVSSSATGGMTGGKAMTSKAGHSTSNDKLMFAILMTSPLLLSGYIRGGMTAS